MITLNNLVVPHPASRNKKNSFDIIKIHYSSHNFTLPPRPSALFQPHPPPSPVLPSQNTPLVREEGEVKREEEKREGGEEERRREEKEGKKREEKKEGKGEREEEERREEEKK